MRPDYIAQSDYDHALKTLDKSVLAIENGYSYRTSHKFTTVANNAHADIYIKTGTYPVIGKSKYSLTQPTEVFFYEDAVIDVSGNSLTLINYNRITTNTASTEIYYSPTINTSGNEILHAYIPASTSAHPLSASGGSAEEISFWLLKPNTNYLVQMWNRSGADASMIFIDLRLCEERDYPL